MLLEHTDLPMDGPVFLGQLMHYHWVGHWDAKAYPPEGAG